MIDGSEHPFVTYKIQKAKLSLPEPLTVADTAWETHGETDKAMYALEHSPAFFWLELKTDTIPILKDAANFWLKHRFKKAV